MNFGYNLSLENLLEKVEKRLYFKAFLRFFHPFW
jgi:hypothetical protein